MECENTEENSESIGIVADNKDTAILPADEEILGSMTTYNSAEGSDAKTQQLRTSARVYKKMKLDTAPSVNVEKPDKKEDVKLEHKKSFRILWTSHDKDLFFEALNEYGKDFENIYSFICSKSKKKGLPDHLMKTKDQVRHLYYRTWHKISKHLQFSEGIKKVSQELYGLINYGEMRRKMRFVSERCISKLQDLIYRGAIAVRDKGKTIRIKTPMCRALRRLNQLDERYDELKLPARIVLELKPKNMYAYLKVQSMAQNPRLRTVVSLQKRLSSIILSVSKRWKTVEAHFYDKAIISKNSVTNDCVPSEFEINTHKLFLSPFLRFTPPEDVEIELPSINLSEYFTRQSICLRAYENKLGIKNSENQLLVQNESNLKILNKGLPKKALSKDQESTSQESDFVREVVSSIIQLQNTVEGATPESEKKSDVDINQSDTNNDDDLLEKQVTSKVDEIRKGWTLSNCTSISIGDLYLMFGKHSKLVLEYSWDDPQRKSDITITNQVTEDPKIVVEEELTTLSDKSPTDLEHANQTDSDWECSISSSLKKLISIAKLHYRKNNKCLCGSVCGGKGNMSVRSKSSTRSKLQTCDSGELNETYDEVPLDENAVDGEPSTSSSDPTLSTSQPSTFRRPNVPTVPMVHLITQLDSIQKLKPRYRKNRRPRLNQMVVERQLSLLPNNTAGGQIVRMNIIPQTNSKMNEPTLGDEAGASHFAERITSDSSGPVFRDESLFHLQNITNLPTDIQENANSEGFDATGLSDIAATPSTSPSRILKESDNQWLSAEVADFSLSSFLGHLDSPSKTLLSIPVCSEEGAMNDETMS